MLSHDTVEILLDALSYARRDIPGVNAHLSSINKRSLTQEQLDDAVIMFMNDIIEQGDKKVM